MKIETDYIKREAQKECYWLQGGTFDLVTWTQAMMQNAADRAGSKIRQLEVALRIKTEEHDCCAADLIQWRKSAESAIGENAELRADLNIALGLLAQEKQKNEPLPLRSKAGGYY